MRYQIVSIRDRAADTFSTPIYVPTIGQAVRSFGDEINRASPDNNLYNHPEDFDLYHLGEYDDSNGVIYQPADGHRMIAVGKDAKR